MQPIAEQETSLPRRQPLRAPLPIESAQRHPNDGTGRGLAMMLGSAGLVGYGLLRRGTAWPWLLAGGSLGVLALRRLRAPVRQFGVQVSRAVTIDAPRQQVFDAWRDFERLAQTMRHIEKIVDLGQGRSRWYAKLVTKGPSIHWDAEIIDEQPGELIAWRSVPGSNVETEGLVQFIDAPGRRGTEVHARLSYRPGRGRPGAAIARALQPIITQEIANDLHRFKQLIEAGEVATTEGQPSGRSSSRSSRRKTKGAQAD